MRNTQTNYQEITNEWEKLTALENVITFANINDPQSIENLISNVTPRMNQMNVNESNIGLYNRLRDSIIIKLAQ